MPIESGSLDEVARLLALLVRLQLGTQSTTILELNKLGFSASRIADLLGTTSATARVTINQQKSKARRTLDGT